METLYVVVYVCRTWFIATLQTVPLNSSSLHQMELQAWNWTRNSDIKPLLFCHVFVVFSHQDPACSNHALNYSFAFICLSCLSSVACVSECCLPAFQPLLLIVCFKISDSHFIKMKSINSKRVCKPDLLQTKPGFVVGLFNHVRTFWFLVSGPRCTLIRVLNVLFRFDIIQCIWSYGSNVC